MPIAHGRAVRWRPRWRGIGLGAGCGFHAGRVTDRRGREYWTKFTFPFGFTDLLTALDSFGRMGMSRDDPDIAPAIAWFRKEQHADGSFHLVMRRGISDKRLCYWLGLAIGRALRRFEAPRG